MIKYQRISGVNIDSLTNLPAIARTPEGEAMGSVPGWLVFLDPSYVDNQALRVRNRARMSTMLDMSFAGGETPDPFREFPDGNPAFVADINNRISIDENAEISDPTQFTIFGVIQPSPRASGSGPGYLVRTSIPESEFTLFMGWTREVLTDFIVYTESSFSGDEAIRYTANFAERSGPSLIMVTHSTTHGMKLYDGGAMVEQNSGFKEPLAEDYLNSERRWLVNGHVTAGMCGLLNIDLGAPENTGHRRAIEKFLMSKYGIPEGPQ